MTRNDFFACYPHLCAPCVKVASVSLCCMEFYSWQIMNMIFLLFGAGPGGYVAAIRAAQLWPESCHRRKTHE